MRLLSLDSAQRHSQRCSQRPIMFGVSLLLSCFSQLKIPNINCMALKSVLGAQRSTTRRPILDALETTMVQMQRLSCRQLRADLEKLSRFLFCSIVAAFTSPPVLANERGDCPEELLVDVSLLAIPSTSAFCLESMNRRGDDLRNPRNVMWPHQQPRAPLP